MLCQLSLEIMLNLTVALSVDCLYLYHTLSIYIALYATLYQTKETLATLLAS